MGITYVHIRTALRKGLLSDGFTCSLYACAPYKGCGHGCRYCDGRAEKYYVDGDFETDIQVRQDLPKCLARALMGERECTADGRRPLLSLGSGVTDVYQPLERQERITRSCVEVLAGLEPNYQQVPPYPVTLLTKSSLVLEDLPKWEAVHKRAGLIVLLTITPMDERLRERLEPGASPIEERWKVVEALRVAGIPVGILAMPLMPGLTDQEEGIHELYTRAARQGVAFVTPGGLSLRPGRQKDTCLQAIASLLEDEVRPSEHPAGESSKTGQSLMSRYHAMYGEERASGSPRASDTRALSRKLARIRRDHELPYLAPHALYRQMVPDYEALHILLGHMEHLYRERGIDTAPLVQATKRYSTWLREHRTSLRRRRTLPGYWLQDQFQSLFGQERLEVLMDNKRLAGFVRQVAEGATFNYLTRCLE